MTTATRRGRARRRPPVRALPVVLLVLPLLLVLAAAGVLLALRSPHAPADPEALHDGDLGVTLRWTDASLNERAFEIRSRAEDGPWTDWRSVPSRSTVTTGRVYEDTHAVPHRGTTYCYEVRATGPGGASGTGAGCAVPTVRNQRQAVPAYFYPDPGTGLWPAMCSAMNPEGGGSVAVLNPDSGPGGTADPGYAQAITGCHDRGHKVLGYVSTDYGRRPLERVLADVDRYGELYDVDGVFVDEMGNDAEDPGTGSDVRAYYRAVYDHVKERGDGSALVMGNPGVPAARAWQLSDPVADVLVVFEGPADEYEQWTPPEWVRAQPPQKFAHLVHATPADRRPRVCELSVLRNAGYLYVTDDVLPNPWDSLPPYWDQQAPACG